MPAVNSGPNLSNVTSRDAKKEENEETENGGRDGIHDAKDFFLVKEVVSEWSSNSNGGRDEGFYDENEND